MLYYPSEIASYHFATSSTGGNAVPPSNSSSSRASSSSSTTSSNNKHRNLFSAAKELVRFIVTTIVLTHGSGVTAASIINSYKSSAATSVKRGRKMDPFFSSPRRRASTSTTRSAIGGGSNGDAAMNLWNFRTFSSVSVASQSSLPASASSGTTNQNSRRGSLSPSNHDNSNVVQSVSSSTQQLQKSPTSSSSQPSVEELKAQLGPLGLLVATTVEVGITTAGSFLSGGLVGYLWGGVTSIPTFLKAPASPQRNKFLEFQQKFSSWNGAACTQGKSWGKLSAAFSGFHVLTKCVRGGKEDRWNSIVGSGMAGAYLHQGGGGWQGRLQSAVTYSSFTYVIDFVFGGGGGGGINGGANGGNYAGGRGGGSSAHKDEFEFQDAPFLESEEDSGF